MTQSEDELLTWEPAAAIFGGVRRSTWYRGVAAGRYPQGILVAPNTVRWSKLECLAALEKLKAARKNAPPRVPPYMRKKREFAAPVDAGSQPDTGTQPAGGGA
jgi:predicted DNA-binding transcriptional regulator AlpA